MYVNCLMMQKRHTTVGRKLNFYSKVTLSTDAILTWVEDNRYGCQIYSSSSSFRAVFFLILRIFINLLISSGNYIIFWVYPGLPYPYPYLIRWLYLFGLSTKPYFSRLLSNQYHWPITSNVIISLSHCHQIYTRTYAKF